ncbi:hypothetical protein CTI14_35415, partial [Methylobacterium radiotolerans]
MCTGCEPSRGKARRFRCRHPATRSRENTKARLLEAAAQVFAEAGLDGASVEAVCERAGFTRGAFYSNFDSKDELFLTLAAGVADARVQPADPRGADAGERGRSP